MIDISKGTFSVKIFRDDFSFSAGHISVYQENLETFHGHDYQVTVEIEGQLAEDFILIDFKSIKDVLKPICKNLNHRLLVPTLNPKIEILQNPGYTKIIYNDRYIELPSSDIFYLELPNLCCEMLAYYIFKEMSDKLNISEKKRIERVSVEITESSGQSASFESTVS